MLGLSVSKGFKLHIVTAGNSVGNSFSTEIETLTPNEKNEIKI
jgi:hypothetical protein